MEADMYVIFSDSESHGEEDNGFWSNETGWGSMDSATRFDKSEIGILNLPMSLGNDAEFMLITDEDF